MNKTVKALISALVLLAAAALPVSAAADGESADLKTIPTAAISGYPSKGASPAKAGLGVSSGGAAIKKTVWLKNGVPMDENEVFDGAFFGAYVVLEANDGCVFTHESVAEAFGSACTPAGISEDGRTAAFLTADIDLVCTHNWVMTSEAAGSVPGSYLCVKCGSTKSVSGTDTAIMLNYASPADKLIRTVAVEGLPTPVSGKTAETDAVKADGNFRIVSARFDTPEFECEKKSTVTVQLEAAEGYSFASLPFAAVNGFIAEITVTDASHATVTYSFAEPGHNFSDWYDEVAPGCTEEGISERKCTVCFKSEEKTIAPLGHGDISFREGYEPDCVTEGSRSYGICSRCGAFLDEEGNEVSESDLVIPVNPDVHAGGKIAYDASDAASGHYELCACGARINAAAHSFGDYSEDEKSGTRTKTCTACGYTESEPISDKPGTVLIIIICAAVVLAALAAVFIGKKMKRGR